MILEGQREGAAKPRAARLASLLKMRETWGCVLVRALTDPISYFLLFWIPLYFQKQYGFDLKQIGLFIWVPYAAAALGNLSGGIIPRTLIGWGWTLDRARKTTMIFMTGTLLVCLIAVTQIANPSWRCCSLRA